MNAAQLMAQAQGGGRRAALAVHALHEQDRAWILQQLPAVQRQRLEGWLAELGAIGIPADAEWMQEFLAAPAQPAPPAARVEAAGAQAEQDAIAQLDAAQALRLLQAEPAGLIAQVLAIRHWPWQDALLEQLGLVKRRRVEQALDALRRQLRPRAPAALNQSLLAALRARAQLELPSAAPLAANAAPKSQTAARWPQRWRAALAKRLEGRA